MPAEGMDITYIPMARGFLYLAAVVDWFSRRVLAWRLSITMEVEFCIEAVTDALARHGRPGIFNTDQGSQFTSGAVTDVLLESGITISMDGKGAWRDNVFVERLWRSVKYEEVYLKAYDTVSDARTSIGRYLGFYKPASSRPSHYVVEGKRLCCSITGPAGSFARCLARWMTAPVSWESRTARSNSQGPSGSGWMPLISPRSAASRRVLALT
jgi:transposase InsO family protein